MTQAPKEYLAEVRDQYEVLPYPMRDYTQERNILYSGDYVSLDGINHEGWGGCRDLRLKGTRFLVAGQGTGDTTVFLAEQLRGTGTEIVSIDLSTASINICKRRLAERGLTNVDVRHMSILDVSPENIGTFDFIESSGVLHHLEDPSAGLAALSSVLKDDGIIALMVYAFYGRLAVYLLQVLMQYLLAPDMHPLMKIDIARAFLAELPKTHPMTFARPWAGGTDLDEPTGSGLYDLLLHSTDRAYTVPQLYEWVEGVGMHMGNFSGEWERNVPYEPDTYTSSPLLRAIISEKSLPEQQTIAELMSGTIIKHVFYATKQPKKEAVLTDDMVPVFGFRQHLFPDFIPSLVQGLAPLAEGAVFTQPVPFLRVPALQVTKSRHTTALLQQLGKNKSVGEILAAVEGDKTELRAEFAALYHALHRLGRLYLRHKDVPAYVTWNEINARIHKYPPITSAA